MTDHVAQVGSPDTELNTSPVLDESEEISLDRHPELLNEVRA